MKKKKKKKKGNMCKSFVSIVSGKHPFDVSKVYTESGKRQKRACYWDPVERIILAIAAAFGTTCANIFTRDS